MQHEILLRTNTFPVETYRVFDRRGHRPSYAAFDLVRADEPHTIAPNMKHAREVRDAYRAWAEKFAASGLATTGTLVIKPYRRVPCRCGDGSCMLCDDNGMVPA